MVWDAGSNVRTECGCMGNLSLEKALPENLLQYQLIITPKDCFKKCTAEKNMNEAAGQWVRLISLTEIKRPVSWCMGSSGSKYY